MSKTATLAGLAAFFGVLALNAVASASVLQVVDMEFRGLDHVSGQNVAISDSKSIVDPIDPANDAIAANIAGTFGSASGACLTRPTRLSTASVSTRSST